MKLSDLRFLKIKVEKHPVTDTRLEYIKKPNAVCVLFVDKEMERTLLVKQYRPGINGDLLEVPAGIIEEGESADSTLVREIREETGYVNEDYEVVYKGKSPLLLSPGYTTEKLYFYIARLLDNNKKPKDLDLDEGEHLTCHWYKIEELGDITTDLKTLYARELLRGIRNI